MRIGILTLPLHTNYGGILQAYALQTVLEGMGHDVVLLNKEKIVIPQGKKLVIEYIKRFIKKYILLKKVRFNAEKEDLPLYKHCSQYTQTFIDKYIHYCIHDDYDKIDNTVLQLDAIIVGSDQIWRPRYIKEVLKEKRTNAYLKFAKKWKIKRISYAASFGTDVWEYSQISTNSIKSLIDKFDAVSVREESGVLLCKKYFDVIASHVLDPTMLLSSDVYSSLIDKCTEVKKHNKMLFNYVLDSNEKIDTLIKNVLKDKQLNMYQLSDGSDYSSGTIQPYVEEWLAAIKYADFIITDSFHACVFCIIFHKPFIVIGNERRGYGRFKSLMEMFKIEKNLIKDPSEYNSDIDYSIPLHTYTILSKWQMDSMNFLKNALNK
jgi:hypothetical protein